MPRNCGAKSICYCSRLIHVGTCYNPSRFLLIRRTAHPHVSLPLPAVEAVSLNPILFTQVPALDTVLTKLSSFIDAVISWPSSGPSSRDQVKQILSGAVIPHLKSRFAPVN